jgi:hypothetical protein
MIVFFYLITIFPRVEYESDNPSVVNGVNELGSNPRNYMGNLIKGIQIGDCSSHPPVFFSTPRVSLNAPKKKGRTTRAVFLHKFSTPYVEKWYVEKRTDRKIRTFSFKNFEFSGVILGFRGVKKS